MISKESIDKRVAVLLGLPLQDVSVVTTAFLRLAARDLVMYGTVMLDGLGMLTLVVQDMVGSPNKARKYEVRFKKSYHLGKLIKEVKKIMEKYGVAEEVDKDMEKHASEGCPECGAKVERHGQTLMCPNCGTAPFEKKSK